MKILVSVINNINSDQRVNKVCNTLLDYGYGVTLIATDLRGKPKIKTRFSLEVIPLNIQKGILFYIEFNLKLFFRLLKIGKSYDIFLANDLDSLWPNYLVAKIYKKKLVFDSHEIFSELPSLYQRPFKKKIWQTLENFLVPKVDAFYTVSEGYAQWFSETYHIPKPVIIKNVPDTLTKVEGEIETILPVVNQGEKVLIYQGEINVSRGIDAMLNMMVFLPNAQLWIIGDGPMKAKYENLHENLLHKDRIHFLGRILPNELKKITPKANLGLSLEEDYGISYRYALPNKIFDYIQAGIPVLGTNLPSIKALILENNVGEIIDNHDPKNIAEKAQMMLIRGEMAYKEALEIAAEKYIWQNEKQKLLAVFNNL